MYVFRRIFLPILAPLLKMTPFLFFPGKSSSNSAAANAVQPSTSKKVITNKTVLPPVVVKQEFASKSSNNPPTSARLNNNNIPSHLDVPKKPLSAKKSPPPEIKPETSIKIEGKRHYLSCTRARQKKPLFQCLSH